VSLALLAIVLALALLTISIGPSGVSVPEIVDLLLGRGDSGAQFVIMTLRVPRLLMAALTGVAFGLAGALFQSVLRNPLASPDIIGVSAGASVGAILGLLILGATGTMVQLYAFVGAVGVALLIYVLAWRRGIAGYRFVLIGIAIAMMANATISFLLARAEDREVASALIWTVGSVGTVRWPELLVVAIGVAVLLPVVALVARSLSVLGLGDDTATALGAPVVRIRVAVILVGAALTAIAAAAVGPLAFVAFVSAPIARRLLRDGSLALVPSALVGAVVVLLADFVASRLIPGAVAVPTGVITGLIGAPYLLWLLSRSARIGKVE
jgi:iron complex transport system permease protein